MQLPQQFMCFVFSTDLLSQVPGSWTVHGQCYGQRAGLHEGAFYYDVSIL